MIVQIQKSQNKFETVYIAKFEEKSIKYTLPFPEPDDEMEAQVYRAIKRKIALLMADKIQFEITSVEYGKSPTEST